MNEDPRLKIKIPLDNDPDYCGLGKITTGPNDPYWQDACVPHDQEFSKFKQGMKHKTNGEVAFGWTINTTKVALKGAYAVATYPLYLLIGGLGGVARWIYLEATMPKEGKY